MTIGRRHLLAGGAAGLTVLASTTRASAPRALPIAAPKSQGFDPERLKRIRPALQRLVDAGEAPGFLAAIMRDGRILHFDSVGYRDVAAKTPMARDTIFRIMSMTKPIVSVAAMMLVEENKLRLTDPLARFMPAFAKQQVYVSGEGASAVFAPAKRQVQVRNLLTHTSGYSYGAGDNPAAKIQRERRVGTSTFSSLAEFCRAAADVPLMFEPGRRWEYGISTDILGHVVELASGQALPDFLKTRILDPLGMVDTAFHVTPDRVARFANRYKRENGALALDEAVSASPFLKPPAAPSGGGGLTGTADDYLRFTAMLANEGTLDGVRLLGPETVRLMRANHLAKEIMITRDAGFGLGFGVDLEPASRNFYGPSGTYHWSGANRTHFWVDPLNRIVGLTMTQMNPFDAYFEEDMRALTYQAFVG
jgi:CubicO group peptidase (beta-lactamase class C family)